ncbi:unnamed protein product [Amaranthus hypochondriacus]
MDQILHMEGGEGDFSYTNNSLVQKRIIIKSKDMIEESVKQVCMTMQEVPECLTIADLGCSSGPNALEAIWEIINISTHFYQNKRVKLPEYKIFLNDLMGNDFNTLFKLLPEFYKKLKKANFGNNCFVSATPGSFHGRLFPTNSLHLVHSSSSLHFLSQAPEGLVSKNGGLNKGAIYITKDSPPNVHKAYYQQFADDFTMFLNSRSEEVVANGQMVLTFRGSTLSDQPEFLWDFQLLGTALLYLVHQGKIEEEKLDKYNVPYYTASIEEVERLIEKQGCFVINKVETFKVDWDLKDTDMKMTVDETAKHVSSGYRAATGPWLANHFGTALMDDLFNHFQDLTKQYLQVEKLEIFNFVISLTRK